jgi:outer membrane murein-binding lipoprotein Lpp
MNAEQIATYVRELEEEVARLRVEVEDLRAEKERVRWRMLHSRDNAEVMGLE